ncbi:MAG TPA: IPTL-CTERM sorting domain-containing protein [Thermoanaerobaculia bacterium]|nr:IPTL-CTERM sorting domain-containing protein [Thermoanaerobaculia bacterium]
MRSGIALSRLALLGVLITPLAITSSGGPQPPVEPGDLLGSTGNVGGSLIDLDPATGAGSFRSNLGAFGPVTEIEFRDDGTLFASTGQGESSLITIDPETGVETLVGVHDFGSLNGLEFVGDTLYGSFFEAGAPGDDGEGSGGVFLVTVDTATAALTPIGPSLPYDPVRGLAYDPQTGTMYGVGTPMQIPEGGGDSLFTIDLGTGATTEIGATGFSVGGLELGPDGVLYGGESSPPRGEGVPSARLLQINTATGAGTAIGGTGFPAISGLTFGVGQQPSALEVPALDAAGLVILAALLGVAGFLALARRR